MAQDAAELPDISSKLAAPSKKSLFERQKAEAQARRQKEQQETAAVYQDFVRSFDDQGSDDDDYNQSSVFASARSSAALKSQGQGNSAGLKSQGQGNSAGLGVSSGFGGNGPGTGAGAGFGVSRRHFSAPTRGGRGRGVSGPGSLGPPPPSLARKRALDGSSADARGSRPGIFGFDDVGGSDDVRAAFQAEEDDDSQNTSHAADDPASERAAPKPALHLSSLPPGTSPAAIKALLPTSLSIDNVRILPASSITVGSVRRAMSAIVTLVVETAAGDLDTAVSALQNRYLGQGFYLSISRHFSSSMSGPMAQPSAATALNQLPFGAKPAVPRFNGGVAGFMGRGGPAGPHRGGFAPPASYNASSASGGYARGGAPPLQIHVQPPHDLKQLKLIHKTIEGVITHGPQLEALLMSRAAVRDEERWAWIWDPRSPGGVYYRWRLWEILTNGRRRVKANAVGQDDNTETVFAGGAVWAAPPDRSLPFEYSTRLQDLISDSDYDSSDDEESGDEGRRRLQHLQGQISASDNATPGEGDVPSYLNPLHKAKLVHLLSRLPTAPARLRRGDVARVTAFAISHAGSGADEVVQLLVGNVQRPFSVHQAVGGPGASNPVDQTGEAKKIKTVDDNGPQSINTSSNSRAINEDGNTTAPSDQDDPSAAMQVGLYAISDLLSSSSTSGVRHAWRYRALIEAAFRRHNTFAMLGRLEKTLRWGRMRAEKWRRSINALLSLWEGWCVFPGEAQASFVQDFEAPPLTAEEAARESQRQAQDEQNRALKTEGTSSGKARWKAVDQDELAVHAADGNLDGEPMDDVDGEPMEDVDGEPMANVDGEPMEDVDGEPMADVEGEQMAEPVDRERIEDKDLSNTTESKASDQDLTKISLASDTNENTPNAQYNDPTSAVTSQEDKRPGRRARPRAADMFADSDGE